MVLSSAVTVGGHFLSHSLVKRYNSFDGENPGHGDGQTVSVAMQVLGVVNFFLFLPLITYIFYTLGQIFPTLAAIEDPLPPYESIPINDPSSDAPLLGTTTDPSIKKTTSPRITLDDPELAGGSSSSAGATWSSPIPVTSSLRKTHRALTASGGSKFRSLFKGLLFQLITQFLMSLASSPFYAILGPQFAHLASLLLFTNLRTAWTHIIITPTSTKSAWKRIPAFKRNFVATYIPILCYWAALHCSILVPYFLAGLAGFTGTDRDRNNEQAKGTKELIFSLFAVAVWIVSIGVVIPAETALLRVQASLLPEEEETIVPFDRSFGGRVEPAVVSGKGFPGVKAALATVSWASWRRIVGQQVKIFGVSLAAFFGIFVVVGLQALVFS
ncbi:hypothetical protein QBC38DRAFT_470576 [Podospora fimiseda]|uniref:Ubiquitin conjugating enzyme n=1 Tax=Podospora fimiseda TaxID=252190 RepID=A0AAN7BUV0_9PEZI|nr:hypothetical protein QBC38DRAFT_470576 [Podospora fimiseda]